MHHLEGKEKTIDVIDRIVGKRGLWLFNRLAQFKVGLINEPEREGVSVTEDDIFEDTFTLKRMLLPIAGIRLGYHKNYSPGGDGLAGRLEVNPEYRDLLTKTESIVSLDNSDIQSTYPNAEVMQVSSLIVYESDAMEEAEKILALYKQQRFIYSMESNTVPFSMNLADSATIYYPAFGFEHGVQSKVCLLYTSDAADD